MNKFTKCLCVLSIGALLAGSGCGIYYGINYHQAINQQQTSNSGMLKVIEELQKNNQLLKDENQTLQLTNQQLQNILKSLKAENETLENQIKSLNYDIATLTKKYEEASGINHINYEEIKSLREEIKQLEDQVRQNNIQISIYEKQLEQYGELNKVMLSFVVLDNVENLIILDKGETLTEGMVATPSVNGYDFLGWSYDCVNVVDIYSEPITENATLTALFKEGKEYKDFQFVNGALCGYSGTDENVVIPSFYYEVTNGVVFKGNKIEVTEIQQGAFWENENIKSITIPETITCLVDQAIYDCSSLEYVVLLSEIPPSVEDYGEYLACEQEVIVYVPDSSFDIYVNYEAWDYSDKDDPVLIGTPFSNVHKLSELNSVINEI